MRCQSLSPVRVDISALRHPAIPVSDATWQTRGHQVELYAGADIDTYRRSNCVVSAQSQQLTLQIDGAKGTYLVLGEFDETLWTASQQLIVHDLKVRQGQCVVPDDVMEVSIYRYMLQRLNPVLVLPPVALLTLVKFRELNARVTTEEESRKEVVVCCYSDQVVFNALASSLKTERNHSRLSKMNDANRCASCAEKLKCAAAQPELMPLGRLPAHTATIDWKSRNTAYTEAYAAHKDTAKLFPIHPVANTKFTIC
jgi:hypothetical protein